MQKQLAHSEKQIEELMSLNEQWTLECREKESQNVLLDVELKSAQWGREGRGEDMGIY